MQTVVLSDIHVDTWFSKAVEPTRWKLDDPDESVTRDTLDFIWKIFSVPFTDAIIAAGDFSNDFLTFKYMVKWLAEHYHKVILVLGNHDLVVRGATPSKANLPFKTSEQKIAAMKDYCRTFERVYLLDGEDGCIMLRENIFGCMGMCDFKCEPPMFGMDPLTYWRRKWFDGKHWRYFDRQPLEIWKHFEKKMMQIVSMGPKVMVTHFMPYEIGYPHYYRNDPENFLYYFHGEKFLELMPNDSYWFCGHSHGRRRAEYVNSKGNVIHMVANPLGYPTTPAEDYMDLWDYRGEKLERTSVPVKTKDFVFDL